MKLSGLQEVHIAELIKLLDGWKFVKSRRHFKKVNGDVIWYFHISCINHADDFDSVGDVTVEFMNGKERLVIIGAELGNIEGVGQKRFPVKNSAQAKLSSDDIYKYFQTIGLPFLERFSNPEEVAAVLDQGDEKAMLISPLVDQHQKQILILSQHYGIKL